MITYSPPIHINPFLLAYLCKYDVCISEKADGIYTTTLPTDIYPPFDFSKYDIEAEYIEQLNIYIIFNIDNIDIEHLNIFERMNWLRSTQNLPIYDYFNKDALINERQIIKKMIDNKTIKWYPKAMWKTTNLLSTLKLLDNVNEYNLHNTSFPIDGWIITPLDGNKPIGKFKPDNQLTIDLLHINDKWYTREKHEIMINLHEFKDGIWRCYWKNNQWVPREIRYDKTKPNPLNIVTELTVYHKNPWKISDITNEMIESPYYHIIKSSIDALYLPYLQSQRNISKNWLSEESIIKGNVLDFGCGKGSSVIDSPTLYKSQNSKIIDQTIKWVGIDIDLASLWRAIKKYPQYQWIWADMTIPLTIKDQIIKFGNAWNIQQKRWHNINETFDVILFNFSIHNCAVNNESWNNIFNEINKRSKIGTILKISILDKTLLCKEIDNKLQINNMYIKILDKPYDKSNQMIEIFYPWIHNKPMIDIVISKDDLIEKLTGWDLIDEFTSYDKTNSNTQGILPTSSGNNIWQKIEKCNLWLTFIKFQ